MDRTTITCSETGINAPADILEKRDRFLKVVMIAMTGLPISLHKRDPHDAFYVGNAAGMEFTSTGENNG